MGAYNHLDNPTRSMALRAFIIVLIGTAIGSVLPETGNLWASYIGFEGRAVHAFNYCFLIVGIIGISVALYIRYRCNRNRS